MPKSNSDSHELIQSQCPACLHSLATVTKHRKTAGPKLGDPCICVHCGTALILGPHMIPRLPTISEADGLRHNKAFQKSLQYVRDLLARRNPKAKLSVLS